MGFFAVIKLILKVWDVIEALIASAKAKDAANWEKIAEEGFRAYGALLAAKNPEETNAAKKRVADNWLNK